MLTTYTQLYFSSIFYPVHQDFHNDITTGKCACDPYLQWHHLTISCCFINDQTVLRPSNTWLFLSWLFVGSPHVEHYQYLPHSFYCPILKSSLLCLMLCFLLQKLCGHSMLVYKSLNLNSLYCSKHAFCFS